MWHVATHADASAETVNPAQSDLGDDQIDEPEPGDFRSRRPRGSGRDARWEPISASGRKVYALPRLASRRER
jgi:hypothetical protein